MGRLAPHLTATSSLLTMRPALTLGALPDLGPHIRLSKHHSLGNEFLIALLHKEELQSLNERRFDWAQMARCTCRRSHAPSWSDKSDWVGEESSTQAAYLHKGIGADGLIIGTIIDILEPPQRAESRLSTGAPVIPAAHPDPRIEVQMMLYNADGSRAEYSGNGGACLANAVAMSGAIHNEMLNPLNFTMLRLEYQTDAGKRRVEWNNPEYWKLEEHVRQEANADPATSIDNEVVGRCREHVWVEMPRITSGPVVTDELTGHIQSDWGDTNFGTADIGNPHLVIIVPRLLSAKETAHYGEQYAAHFPNGINVEFVHGFDGSCFEMCVWERGVGVTSACGTGAVSAALMLERWKLLDEDWVEVAVHMPGGSVSVKLAEYLDEPYRQMPVWFETGPVHLFDIDYPITAFLPEDSFPLALSVSSGS